MFVSLAGWGGCEPAPRGDASATEAAFVPAGLPIHRSEARTFEVEGREVRITHVEYGQLMDCASGCFASHVCAIEDGEDVQLFYASWTNLDEQPDDLEPACLPGEPETGGQTRGTCEPAGRCHPLNLEPRFQRWAEDQVGSGPFRFCVNELAYEGYTVAPCARR